MKVFIAIIACTLFLGAMATADPEIASIVNKMESSRYGKTLLDTIALQMEAGDPVQDLIDMLQSTEDDLQNAQDEDDEFIQAEQEQCDIDLARLVAEVEAAQAEIERLQGQLDQWIPERDQKERELEQVNETLGHLRAKLVEIEEQKALKDQEWQEEKEQHEQALYVIEKAKNIIVESVKANSFLQKGNTAFAQVSSHFAKHAKTQFKRQSWSKIFNLLSQITSSAPVQANQSLVQSVIDICDDLISKIEESREIEERDYKHFVEEYETYKGYLVEQINVGEAKKAELETKIAQLNKAIYEAQIKKQEQEERARQKQAEHDELLKSCDDSNIAYAKRREARYDQLEVVSDAIGLLQSKLRTFRQYVNERLNTDVVRAK